MKRLRRLIWFIAGRLTLITAVLGLATIAFYFAMNAANILVILKDGMAQRAMTVMMDTDRGELNKYFAANYLARDPVLAASGNGTNPYDRYRITGIDHRLRMEWMWAWPWEDMARATITEEIPGIDGRILSSWRAVTPQEQLSPPAWQSGRYDVVLIRESGQWHIRSMTFLGDYP